MQSLVKVVPVKVPCQRRKNEKYGRPMSFLYLEYGKGYAFKGAEGGYDEEKNKEDGEKVDVELADSRQLGIVTLGELREHPRIVKFKNFLKNWFLCYFSPMAAREISNAGPQKYLNRLGNNINNVAEYMYREDRKEFSKILENIQTKLPGIQEIKPVKMPNGQLVLEFLEQGFEQPENGLYHKYLADLAVQMKNAIKGTLSKQLFVTTHSPFFVNALSPKEVWVLEKQQDGFSKIKRASEISYFTI